MAHRSSFRSSCDILEIEEEELNPLEHYKGTNNHPKSDRRSLAPNVGRISSLEDDLNQLFEIFNRRSSSQRMLYSPQNNAGPSKKKSSKKPVKASTSSPERTSLKQAFRGLCISQASQMASVNRSAKSVGSSKAGQIMTLYKNVAVDDSTSMGSSSNGARASSKQIERVIESYDEKMTSPGKISVQAEFEFLEGSSSLVENSQDEMLYSLSPSSSPVPDDNLLRTAKTSPFETPMFSASRGCASRESSTELSPKDEHGPPPSASRSSDGRTNIETVKSLTSCKEDDADAASSPYKLVNKGSAAKSSKLEEKASAANGGRKINLLTVPSAGLANGSHVKKPSKSVSRLVKPVIKTKNFVKRKSKKDMSSAHSPNDTRSEFNNVLYPGSTHIVCPRCQCVLNEEWEEVEEDSASAELSPLSPAMSPSPELSPLSAVLSPYAESPDNVFSDISTPTFNLNNTNKSKEAAKARENLGEITQISVSGPDECSSSTSISQENNLGRPSSWDRPHMSKDARWQAI